MSAEPKVLLEWKEPVVTGRIMSDRTVHMAFDDGTSWKLCDDDSVSVLAIYDALEARHARVREAAERVVKCGDEFAKAAINCGKDFQATADELAWRKRAAEAYADLRAALETP